MNDFMFYPEITDKDFNEKIYMKKEFRDTEIINSTIEKTYKKEFTLEPHQIFLKNFISPDTPYNGVLILHGTGAGKCMAINTPIIMHDGTIKPIQDIIIGDKIMGDDSTPRIVLSTTTGKDKMYDIIQKNGNKYTVNSEHILTLKVNPEYIEKSNKIIIKYIDNNEFQEKVFNFTDKEWNKKIATYFFEKIKKNNVLEISVKNYLKLSHSFKKRCKGYKVILHFDEKETDCDPFQFGENLVERNINIPHDYKCNSFEKRKELLHGILKSNQTLLFDKIKKNIVNDIVFLIRSIGYTCSIKNQNNKIKIEYTEKLSTTPITVKYNRFDNYYGFTISDNGRYVLDDCTVTHNTCTAISIAEGFKNSLKSINKKILIISTLKYNFIKELYDFQKEKTKKNYDDSVQCTGSSYELPEESLYMTPIQKERAVDKLKKRYYQVLGYQKFANQIIENTSGWKGEDDKVNENIKKYIAREFDDRVIIIDEIQNIKTEKGNDLSKSIQPILQSIIKYGKNIKLILMSATPMFDRPDEIIFYINLLLENDKRETIQKSDIFNYKDGTLKPNGETILRDVFKGYVSYVRAEKPFTFPFRIYPDNAVIPQYKYYMNGDLIPEEKRIRYTRLILCEMSHIQNNTYSYYLQKKLVEGKITNENSVIVNANENQEIKKSKRNNVEKNNNGENNKKDASLLFYLTKISNIVYPMAHNNENIKIGSFKKDAIDADYDNGLGGYYRSVKMQGKKSMTQYKYQSHAIFSNNTPFADENHLIKYSIKFSNILHTIKKSVGLIFIYSQFIEQGALPLALILEQNGFERKCYDGEFPLLDFPKKRKGICYKCGNEKTDTIHNNDKHADFHGFRQAKYILHFGEKKDVIKIKKEEALRQFSSQNNKYGEEIKIFIGTRTVSEGLDFKRLRQVHIMEPWYNLSRNEQIIGRAIRNMSHRDLLPEENNVEIYTYASVLKKSTNKKDSYTQYEAVDLKNYRIAENKDIIIKKIMRIMKESAVDCVLFKKGNVITDTTSVKQITSSNKKLNVSVMDKPYSQICDYNENCDYKCNWCPKKGVSYPINVDTYNIRFASTQIEKIKKTIKNLFKENLVYYLGSLENKIISQNKDTDKLFIYSALESIVNNKNEIVYDKFSRKGYIIYRGDYYIFQPFDLERDETPLLYRSLPVPSGSDFIDLENIIVEYEKNNKQVQKKKNGNENTLDSFLKKIEELYNKHITILHDEKNKSSKDYFYLLSIIGCLYDTLELKDKETIIKNILTEYINKSKKKYIQTIINYLDNNNILLDFYRDIYPNKISTKKKTDPFFIGFILDDKYYVIDNIDKIKSENNINKTIEFIEADNDLILQIKEYKKLNVKNNNRVGKKNNEIYGLMLTEKNTKVFKIINTFMEQKLLTKESKESRRSQQKGQRCTSYSLDQLEDIRKKLNMYHYSDRSKRQKDFLCMDIQLYLRCKQLQNADNKIWFYT